MSTLLTSNHSELTSKLLNHVLRDALLEVHFTIDIAGAASVGTLRLRTPSGDAEPRSVQGSLRCVPTKDVQQYLNVALRLHEASHDAVTQEQFVASERHSWDDGVVGPLSTLEYVLRLSQKAIT